MIQYLNLLRDVYENGTDRKDRTGVGTRGVFGRQVSFDLKEGFPILTTKKVAFKTMATELCWFLRGRTDVQWLQERDCHIWDSWIFPNGDLGPVYGKQWRDFGGDDTDCGVDQIKNLVHDLKTNPFSRRHLVSAWNPVDVPKMGLPPCHFAFQCYVQPKPYASAGLPNDTLNHLSMHMNMRSTDIFLGLPFNIASYALLLECLARQTEMIADELVISFGDLHLYSNHFEQAREQLSRTPSAVRPMVSVVSRDNIWDHEPEDFSLLAYEPQAAIKAPVAV